MKNLITFCAALLITASLFLPQQASAQSPEKMSYQAVVRDGSNNLVSSTAVGMQISILQGSSSGTAVYVETQTPTSNANGLVSLEIGSGTVMSGDFINIDWVNGPYFIKTETDPTGGTSYSITGTTQLMSVPYALHAKTAENVINDQIDDADNDPTNEIQDLQLAGNILTITNNGTATDIDLSAYLDNTDTQLTEAEVDAMANDNGYLTSFTEVDGSILNEIQDLQLAGNILTITNNGTATDIDLSAYLDNTDTQLSDGDITALGYIKDANDADANPTNEIQDLQLAGNILTITNNGTATAIDLSAYLDNTDTQLSDGDITALGYIKNANDADANPTNEIQALTISSDTVYLSNGGFVKLPAGFDAQYSSLTGTPSNVSSFNNDSGYLSTEIDGSVTNEIQALTISNDTVYLSNGGFVKLPTGFDAQYSSLTGTPSNVSSFTNDAGYLSTEVDGSVTNEIQALTISNDTVYLSNGGFVKLPAGFDAQYSSLTGTPSNVSSFNNDAGYLSTEVDGSITNEIQTISRTGTTVTLNNGGGTYTDSVGVYTQGTGIDITNNVISATVGTTLDIGDSYQGGIIFWLDATGQHGLIAATADQNTGIQWYNGTSTVTNAVRDGIGAGKFNTERIIAKQGAGAYAAQICANYQGGNYGDWYLPSKYELNLLYQRRAVVGGFAIQWYWSSSEDISSHAWNQYFGNGSQSNINKSNTRYVRAVRAF